MTLPPSFGTLVIIHEGKDIKRWWLRMPAHSTPPIHLGWVENCTSASLQPTPHSPPGFPSPLLPEKQTPHCSRAGECSDDRKTSLHPSIWPTPPHSKHAAACGTSTLLLPLFFSFLLSFFPMIRRKWHPPTTNPHPVHSFFPCSMCMKLQSSALFSAAANWGEKRKRESEGEMSRAEGFWCTT